MDLTVSEATAAVTPQQYRQNITASTNKIVIIMLHNAVSWVSSLMVHYFLNSEETLAVGLREWLYLFHLTTGNLSLEPESSNLEYKGQSCQADCCSLPPSLCKMKTFRLPLDIG